MTVKEMIEKLQGMNQEAIVFMSEDWQDKLLAEIVENEDVARYHQEVLDENVISEIEESHDKKYVRLW